MADINTLISSFSTGIVRDTEIKALADTEYGRDQSVFIGLDPRNEPGEENTPLFIIGPVGKTTGKSNVPGKVHEIGISAIVYDDRFSVVEAGLTKYSGVGFADEFRKLALAVVIDLLPDNLMLHEIDTEYDQASLFPYISASMTLTIIQRKILGVGESPYE